MINIVIPMAGRGSRLAAARHDKPKPLIEVIPGKSMIEFEIDYLSLPDDHQFIFICLSEHVRDCDLEHVFRSKTKKHRIVMTDTVTSGPASSVMLAEPWIDNQDELLVAYCDDYLDLDIDHYLLYGRQEKVDGMIVTYPSANPMSSYAVLGEDGRVLRVAEKEIISPLATAGLYYFRKGQEFVRSAKQMMRENQTTHGEFFVSPVYNQLIRLGKTVFSYSIRTDQNMGVGNPDQLAKFRHWASQHQVQPYSS